MPRFKKGIPSASLKTSLMAFVLFFSFVLSLPAQAQQTAADAQSVPDRLKTVEKHLETLEKKQDQVLQNQEKILENIQNLRIWIRRN